MKKYFPFVITASLVTLTPISAFTSAAELRVEINNIQEVKGNLYISAYRDEAGFKTNNNFVKREKVAVDKNRIEVNLGDLPEGDYAIKVYQDVNSNGKMDFHGMLPQEPYGSSGSSSDTKNVAPPNFSDAKFTLDKPQTIHIELVK